MNNTQNLYSLMEWEVSFCFCSFYCPTIAFSPYYAYFQYYCLFFCSIACGAAHREEKEGATERDQDEGMTPRNTE